MSQFKEIEGWSKDQTLALESALNAVKFNQDGLIPVIAQQYDSGEVLMLAWMNRDAITTTLNEGQVCYWSRSRQSYWRKGETSGHVQTLKSMSFDCDGDAILLQVDQAGPACHTNRRSCFYLTVEGDSVRVTDNPG